MKILYHTTQFFKQKNKNLKYFFLLAPKMQIRRCVL